ncbi:MAG: acyl-CoA dehydrogenase [bacterium]|nr:acyl-CoA dehydrogenase [bacterium]
MNYELTTDQAEIRKKYEEFSAKELAPKAGLLDNGSEEEISVLIKENLRKLGDIGYLGIIHDKEYGGSNLDLISYTVSSEAIGKACSSTFISAMSSSLMFGLAVEMFGTKEQKNKYLPQIITGDTVGAFGITEPEAGSDIAGINTKAVKKGDTWILNGSKSMITNAPIADTVLVLARTDPAAEPAKSMTAFLIPSNTAGFSAGCPVEKMGYRGSPTGEIILNDCELPESAVLGYAGGGFSLAAQMFEYGKIGMAAASLGIATACMDEANSHSKERRTFGKIINRYQEVSFKLADMMILTDLSRLLLYRAAWAKETDDPEADVLTSSAKLFASESATEISGLAMQVHGGSGYMKGAAVERLYRDAKLGEIIQGTSEMQRISIARTELDRFKD